MDAPAAPPLDLARPGSLTRSLLEAMTEGVSLSREDGTIVYTNPAEERLFGYGGGELLGRHVSVQNALPPGESRARVSAVIDELRASGRWEGEWINRRKDGTSFPSRTRISAVTIDGEPHWLCVREDIERERTAMRAAEEERTRLRLATEAAGIGIWDLDEVTGAVACSDRLKEIFGLPRDREMTRNDFQERIHPEDWPLVTEQSARALDPATRARETYEYRVVRPDGAVRWVLASGEAIFEEGPEGPRAVRYLGGLQDITERRALEQAERDVARRLRLALDAGRMAVWDVDLLTDTATGSAELNRLLGFPDDWVLDPKVTRKHYAPGEQERLQAEAQAVLARGGTGIENEFRYIRPDTGEMRWLRLRCEILFEGGLPFRAVGVLSDETERRRAEEDLRASEARLQLAAEAAGAGVWERDLATGRAVWSPLEYVHFGLDPATPPEALHALWRRAVHPEDLPRVLAKMDRALREGRDFTDEYRILRGDGAMRWIRSHGTFVTGADGRPARILGIELDVTAERQETEVLRARAEALEDEVEERRREQDRILDLSQDLFAVAGFDGRLRSVNPAWTRLLGWSEEELLARPFHEIIHPDDRADAAHLVGGLRRSEAVRGFQDRLIAKDGRAVWIDWAAVAEGERFYAVGRDVTHEREREEILRQAQKMDALGQLTGGIAHDFNNLLQAVQGSLALIARRPEDVGRVRLLAEEGMQVAQRGASLTGQLLAFSRAGPLDLRPVGLRSMLEGLRDLLRRSLGPMVVVEMDLPDGEVAARADRTQLEMAVLNLVINARDAMPEGGRVRIGASPVAVGADPELPPGDYLLLEVSDDGSGMAPEVLRRAVEPFFTTKGVGKGTGLGLSQVYGMARQAGGTTRIESAPGEGTTVRLWLPRAAGEDVGEAPEASRATRPERGATVLVVDDDPDVRRWLVAAVHALGHAVLEAADGPSGLAALDGRPDVAILDFAMPGMNGAELARALQERRPDLPVIMATGYADPAALPSGLRVLRKPFSLADLEAALTEAVAAARAEAVRPQGGTAAAAS